MTSFFIVVCLVIVASAMAFNSPLKMGRVSARVISKSSLSMAPEEVAVQATNVLTQFSQVLSAETDFGGYAGPAGSLLLIGFLILTLSPPLAQKNAE
mmetsp:Transcript_20485/g.29372  ORF Transcript_20485/g.29372 Transcript_20485/m.29372 type:complete len:97 (-) Transcript_20485:147-437(-)